MQKRVLGLLITILLVIASIQVISSASCDILSRSACTDEGGKVIMGVSDLTNAHGEFRDEGTYDNVLCCDFGNEDTTCYGDNKIIGLSSSTNAHAEEPGLGNYPVDVCYEDLVCENLDTTGTDCSSINKNYPFGILSLSDYTNAHIGAGGGLSELADYPSNTICCGGPEFSYLTCELTNASWEDEEVYEDTNVGLIVKGTDCNTATISFEILEDDAVIDDSVNINPSNVDFIGDEATGQWLKAEWQEDTFPNGDGNPPEYYFIATVIGTSKTINSKDFGPLLIVKERKPGDCDEIFLCSDYNTSLECKTDYCGVNETSAPGTVDCDNPLINCSCSWDSETEKCKFVASFEGEGNGGIGGGTCEYKQETTDDCSDGYLTYNFTATWIGLPENKPSWCEDDTETIECPAQVQLPFFNTYSILIAIALIVLIYIILIRKKSSRKKRK